MRLVEVQVCQHAADLVDVALRLLRAVRLDRAVTEVPLELRQAGTDLAEFTVILHQRCDGLGCRLLLVVDEEQTHQLPGQLCLLRSREAVVVGHCA